MTLCILPIGGIIKRMLPSCVWGDFDLDGNQDLFHAQYSYRVEGESGEPARLSRLYLSQGAEGDWKLRDMTWQTGLRIHGTWTAASIDFDRDGDLDLVCASPRENLKLYRNDIKRNGSAIVVRLVGDPADGVPSDPQGARLMLHVGDKTYTRELVSSSSGATGTQRSGALHFGIGSEAATADSLVVTWGASKRLLFRDVAVDAEYLVDFQSGMISELEVNPLSVEDDGYNPLVPSETPRLTITAERRSDGTLYLKLPTDDTGIFPLRVVATDGRPFFEGNVRFSNGGEALLMLPASMPAGHYLVGLTIDDRPMSGQFEVK